MTIKNILVKIQYDGSKFFGYQTQKSKRSVQEEVEKAVRKVTGENNRIIAAGRTDAGVHANCQYVNFLTAKDIRPDKFYFHLQAYLPDDILALESKDVSIDFHARFSTHMKTYKYIICTEKNMHPIYNNYMEHITYKLDLEKMDKAIKLLVGEHDFKSFMFTEKDVIINTRRKIDNAYFKKYDDRIELYFQAESFLHNQVRIMSGSLIEVARGKISIEKFKKYFDKDNMQRANPTLKASGLYLDRIDY